VSLATTLCKTFLLKAETQLRVVVPIEEEEEEKKKKKKKKTVHKI
jgi:hypothetical protein